MMIVEKLSKSMQWGTGVGGQLVWVTGPNPGGNEPKSGFPKRLRPR